MRAKLVIAGPIAAALVAASVPAGATIITVTLSGADERVNDNATVFGFGAGTITGRAFTEVFLIDTTAGSGINATNTGVSSNSIFDAGPAYAVGGTLTIAGGTPFTVAGSNYSSAFTSTYGSSTSYQLSTDDAVGTRLDNALTVELDGSDLPTTLTQPFDGDLAPSDYIAAYITDEAVTVGNLPGAIGDLYATHLTVSVPGATAAVPEPATWATMVSGFGLVGGALRRRERAAATA